MKLHDQLNRICDCLDCGVSARREITEALVYSVEQAQQSPGSYSVESLHISKTGKDSYPDYPKFALELCRELGSMQKAFIDAGSNRYAIRSVCIDHAATFRRLVDQWSTQVKTSVKRSRGLPDHKITEWYRKNYHKYPSRAEAVRQYLTIPSDTEKKLPGMYSSLYNRLSKDLDKRPIQPPKNKRKVR